MTIAEIRAKLKELEAERRSLLEKIRDAKTADELTALELDKRKNALITAEFRNQLAEAEQSEQAEKSEQAEQVDPASLRSDGEENETRSLKPLTSVIKTGGTARKDAENDADDTAYRKAFRDFALRKVPIPAELRADEVTSTSDVSAVIPKTVVDRILEELELTGMILPLITRTYYNGFVSIPVSNVRPTATWVNEGAGSDKQKKTVNTTIDFKAFKLRCAISMTLETSVMSLAIFETTFVRQVVEAMKKAIETAIISGAGEGSHQPKGILKETPPEGQALKADKPSYQLLTDAEAAVPAAYENGVMWCMTKKTFMSFIGMTDASGQPIARVNAGFNGRPERTLLGRGVVITDYMESYSPSLKAGTVYAFLFNFKDYVLNTNMEIRTKWYEDNENEDQVFKAVMLADGKVVTKNSLVTIAKATAAAGA